MKLTQRQLDKIAGLINEEAEVRKNLHESMYENRKKSFMTESLMFENETGLEDAPEKFVNDISDDVSNYSRDFIPQVNGVLYKSLDSYMKLSGVVDMTPRAWQDELEMYDIYESEMELATDISNAILAYAKRMMKAAVQVASVPEDVPEE
jgi:hypothetical protein